MNTDPFEQPDDETDWLGHRHAQAKVVPLGTPYPFQTDDEPETDERSE